MGEDQALEIVMARDYHHINPLSSVHNISLGAIKDGHPKGTSKRSERRRVSLLIN